MDLHTKAINTVGNNNIARVITFPIKKNSWFGCIWKLLKNHQQKRTKLRDFGLVYVTVGFPKIRIVARKEARCTSKCEKIALVRGKRRIEGKEKFSSESDTDDSYSSILSKFRIIVKQYVNNYWCKTENKYLPRIILPEKTNNDILAFLGAHILY